MEPGTLAKILHDFLTNADGELCLLKGDYFLIHKIIDKHWCYGESHGKYGKFPLNYLHKVTIPELKENECLFVTTANFTASESGDLSFAKGELIVGIRKVEEHWFFGRIDTTEGIFPISHAWLLDSNLLKKSSRQTNVQKRAKVKVSMKAQLDEELDLKEGEVITVTEILEDGWCRGFSEDGKEGTFPEGFVTFIEEAEQLPNYNAAEASTSSSTAYSANHSTIYQNNSLPKEPDVVDAAACNYDSIENDPAPSYEDLFPDYPRPKSANSENTYEDNILNPLGVVPYAITLYNFTSQFPNELSFQAGEVVHLLRHIDSDWAEGSIDNEKGIFPKSYVNIVVDCDDSNQDNEVLYSNIAEISNEEETPVEYSDLQPGTTMKVEHPFQAQLEGDLTVSEGEIVTVVELANQDWINVRNKLGESGLCPTNYLKVFKESDSYVEAQDDSLDDFVVLRKESPIDNNAELEKREDMAPKRQSVPHRPAPPAPEKGRPAIVQHKQVTASTSSSETKAKKKTDHRQDVIFELYNTEKEFVRDLKITYETFNLHNPSILEARGINTTVLFGNIMEVIEVAEELLDKITSARESSKSEQKIGPCFVEMAEKLQDVYLKYCANNEAALFLLKKYDENKEIMTIFDKGIETLRYQVACFDMSSILIKPVQRILKYPLLLNELMKNTDDDHPDKIHTALALQTMTAVASNINEHKRRKDMVSKYLDFDNTLKKKMANLNMHSVAKKSFRLSTKVSASLGLTNISVDSNFEELERQFKYVEKCAETLLRDVEECVSCLGQEVFFMEVIGDLFHEYFQGVPNVEVAKFKEIRKLISTRYLEEFKQCVDQRVNQPLNMLMKMLRGPAVLIEKRHDKLLDYGAADYRVGKNNESRQAQEELTSAKCNYEALNKQLLEELPILIKAATTILVNCIMSFAHARKLLAGKTVKRHLLLSESVTMVSLQNILESFLVSHNLQWNQITRHSLAESSNPSADSDEPKLCLQTGQERESLRRDYPPEKLYMAKQNVTSHLPLEINLQNGTWVAVIKKQDPMGNATRWYVDNGKTQGFAPSKSLQPLQAHQLKNLKATTDTPDLINLDIPTMMMKNASSFTSYANLNTSASSSNQTYGNVPNASANQRYQNLNQKYYVALFDFPGNVAQSTLPLKTGQIVKLVKPNDDKGNSEWWFVKNREGVSGYVPQNFLQLSTQ